MTVALTAWDPWTWDKSPQMVRALWRTFRHTVDLHRLHVHAVQGRALLPADSSASSGGVHTCPPADPPLDQTITVEEE